MHSFHSIKSVQLWAGGLRQTVLFLLSTLMLTACLDTTPDGFHFESQTGVEPEAWVESNTVILGGLKAPANISVTGGEYAIGGSDFTAESGLATAGDAVKVRVRSSAEAGGETRATLTVGSQSSVFKVTTRALIANADAYVVSADGELSLEASTGLMANDTVFGDQASVSLETEPALGAITLGEDGAFVYTPSGEVGTDNFSYALSHGHEKSVAEVVITISAATSDNGFTPIVPSNDSRLIYVSSSQGSDDNDGLSQESPVKTLAKAFDLARENYPDHIYLKRGDVWRGENLSGVRSGRNASEPAVVAFYGESGARPRLENTTSFMNIWQGKPGDSRRPVRKHVWFIGLDFYAYSRDPNHPKFSNTDAGSPGKVSFLSHHEDILFEDNLFRYVEVTVQGFEHGDPENFRFRRNIFTGAYVNTSSYHRDSRPSNMYTAKLSNLLLEENVFDYGGWNPNVVGAGANMFNHNVYLQSTTSDVVVRGNIFTRASSHGIQARGGALVENNFFGRNAVSLLIGYNSDNPLAPGVRAHALNNVISEGFSMAKGIDPCEGTNLCTLALWGLDLSTDGAEADYRAEGNVVQLHAPEDDRSYDVINPDYGLVKKDYLFGPNDSVVAASNNLAYHWVNDTQGDDAGYPDPDRNLADYNASLGGEQSFDAFMQVVLNRPLQSWDERYSAAAINDYIRAGYFE